MMTTRLHPYGRYCSVQNDPIRYCHLGVRKTAPMMERIIS
jgi:hypothetical protein